MPKRTSSLCPNGVQLSREIEGTARHLDALPEETEWTQSDLETLEDLRRTALLLARAIERIFAALLGG